MIGFADFIGNANFPVRAKRRLHGDLLLVFPGFDKPQFKPSFISGSLLDGEAARP